MRQHIWTLSGLVFLTILCGFTESRSLVKRQIQADASLDPAFQEVEYDDEDRDKRAVNHHVPDPKFAVKNAVLGFLFNPSKGFSYSQPRAVTSTTTKRPTTTEDIVIFEKNQPVSLDIPNQLFGSGFTLITRVSTVAGDYMINSAIRLQRMLEVFRPVIRALFGAKGFVSEVTTDKPIFSDPSSTS